MKLVVKRTLCGVGLLLLCLGLAYGGLTIYMHRVQPQMFAAPTFDSTPPVLPNLTGERRVLVFSKTNGFRHIDAIPAANALFQKLAEKNHWGIYSTENNAVFNATQLAQFDAVIWNNASGDLLTNEQRSAFESWLQRGGGFLGVHAAGDSSHEVWPWYVDNVVRAHFVMHPLLRQLQATRVNVEAADHPVMQGVASWVHTDEWYNFKSSPRQRTTVLASLDESTYHPEHWAMGADHPIIWSHNVGEGRVVYSALGHTAEAFADPAYQQVLENALVWVLSQPHAAP